MRNYRTTANRQPPTDNRQPTTDNRQLFPNSLYTPEKWWTDREKIQRVFYEWTKMVAFVLFE